MRFGLFVPQGWRLDLVGIDPAAQWETMKGVAQHADAGPWESIWVYDHFHTVPKPMDEATHEAWTLMSAFGAATERVRLGQMCTCIGYRNPVYLAKVAATCDVVSGGRVEMGIGAGRCCCLPARAPVAASPSACRAWPNSPRAASCG